MLNTHRIKQYALLMRLDKPIGMFLLLWPTLWALWLAAGGVPQLAVLGVFIMGTVLMRSAGCILNDLADRRFDGLVERTQFRPLVTGQVSVREAILLVILLVMIGFWLVWHCNWLTIALSVIGLLLAIIYPYLKRVTHLPQLGLSLAFAWGIPMSFAAVLSKVPFAAWVLYGTTMIWPIIYDTMYAMVDKNDDVKIGVKSTAILFSAMDKLVIALLQTLFVVLMVLVGILFELTMPFYLSLLFVIGLFFYQQWLIRYRDRKQCFQAFLNNNWVGFVLFIGIVLGQS